PHSLQPKTSLECLRLRISSAFRRPVSACRPLYGRVALLSIALGASCLPTRLKADARVDCLPRPHHMHHEVHNHLHPIVPLHDQRLAWAECVAYAVRGSWCRFPGGSNARRSPDVSLVGSLIQGPLAERRLRWEIIPSCRAFGCSPWSKCMCSPGARRF